MSITNVAFERNIATAKLCLKEPSKYWTVDTEDEYEYTGRWPFRKKKKIGWIRYFQKFKGSSAFGFKQIECPPNMRVREGEVYFKPHIEMKMSSGETKCRFFDTEYDSKKAYADLIGRHSFVVL